MLTLSSGFQKQVDLKNPNRVVFAKLYYDNEVESVNVSTKSTIIESTQYHGIITRFSSPKSTWNWDSGNNVVVTSPTIELGNFESDIADSSLIDEFYNKNFLGRKVEIFIGFQNATSEDEFQQFYKGKIEDLQFSDGSIRIIFTATDLPDNEIAGAIIDAVGGLVGSNSVSGLHRDVDGMRVPVVYGNGWCSPGINVKYGEDNEISDKVYLFNDVSAFANGPSNGYAKIKLADRKYTGRNERLVYLYQNEYLVPLSSYDFTTSGTSIWSYSYNNAAYGGCTVTVDSDNQQYFEGAVTAAIPLRLAEGVTLDTETGVSIVSGDWDDVQDSSNLSYMEVRVSGGVAGPQRLTAYSPGNMVEHSLRYFSDGQGEYAFMKERPIHVSDKPEADVTYFYGRYGIQSTNQSLPSYWIQVSFNSEVYAQDGTTRIGWTGDTYQAYQLSSNYFKPTTYPQTAAAACGVAGGGWSGSEFVGSGFIETAYGYDPYGAEGDALDATLSYRESLDTYHLKPILYFMPNPYGASWVTNWRIYNWFLLHSSPIELPTNYIYTEVLGPEVPYAADLFSLDSSSYNVVVYRPMHYIELMLRNMGFDDADFDETEWTNSNDEWDSVFGNRRDYSGFTITESTKFNDFLKEYLNGETYTIYRDELGKFRIKIIKEEYGVSDVDDTINYEDCSSFEMSISNLNSVATDIGSLKLDYMKFNDEYLSDSPWYIESGVYSYSYYDYLNSRDAGKFSRKELFNKYTSHSCSYCVDYGGTSYSVRKNHTSSASINPTNSTYYNAIASSPNAKDPEWVSGSNYTTESAEAYQIARRYLNQFGNRHRIIKLTSKNMQFYKYQIGDVVSFENVPDSLLGMEISGFAGSSASSVTMNGQTVYPYFMISSILKDADKVQIECFQLHNLTDLTVKRG